MTCDPRWAETTLSRLRDLDDWRERLRRLETPGGGGYGAAHERVPEKVAEDVRLGYVSAAAAAADYGVVVAADGTLDRAATTARRARDQT